MSLIKRIKKKIIPTSRLILSRIKLQKIKKWAKISLWVKPSPNQFKKFMFNNIPKPKNWEKPTAHTKATQTKMKS